MNRLIVLNTVLSILLGVMFYETLTGTFPADWLITAIVVYLGLTALWLKIQLRRAENTLEGGGGEGGAE